MTELFRLDNIELRGAKASMNGDVREMLEEGGAHLAQCSGGFDPHSGVSPDTTRLLFTEDELLATDDGPDWSQRPPMPYEVIW